MKYKIENINVIVFEVVSLLVFELYALFSHVRTDGRKEKPSHRRSSAPKQTHIMSTYLARKKKKEKKGFSRVFFLKKKQVIYY